MLILISLLLAEIYINYKNYERWRNSEMAIKVIRDGFCYPILEVCVFYFPIWFTQNDIFIFTYAICITLLHAYLILTKASWLTILVHALTTFYLKWTILSCVFALALIIEVVFASIMYTSCWFISRYTRDIAPYPLTRYEREMESFDIDE